MRGPPFTTRSRALLSTALATLIVLTLALPAASHAALPAPQSAPPAGLTLEEAERILRAPRVPTSMLVLAASVLNGQPATAFPSIPDPHPETPLFHAVLALYLVSGHPITPEAVTDLEATTADVDLRVQVPTARLLLAMATATRLQQAATATLDEGDKRAVGTYEPEMPATAEAARAFAKIDMALMAAGGVLLTRTIEDVIPHLKEARAQGAWPKDGYRDPHEFMEIGTEGDDRYETRRWLTLDPAGNDNYTGSSSMGAAAPLGDVLIAWAWPIPVAVNLDLAGNETYHYPGWIWPRYSMGVGISGIGTLWDVEGDDLYKYGDLGYAARGVGIVVDEAGHDNRTSLSGYSHATADNHGIALFHDKEGDDIYYGRYIAFGTTATSGQATFKDEGGKDRYRADGGGAFGYSSAGGKARFYDLGGATDVYPTWCSCFNVVKNNATWTFGPDGIGEDR